MGVPRRQGATELPEMQKIRLEACPLDADFEEGEEMKQTDIEKIREDLKKYGPPSHWEGEEMRTMSDRGVVNKQPDFDATVRMDGSVTIPASLRRELGIVDGVTFVEVSITVRQTCGRRLSPGVKR